MSTPTAVWRFACSVSRRASSQGTALYLRRDVLEGYAKRRRREVVLVIRGERTPDYELVSQRPRWWLNAARTRADEWVSARRLRDFAGG
jgi:hypothetical protein